MTTTAPPRRWERDPRDQYADHTRVQARDCDPRLTVAMAARQGIPAGITGRDGVTRIYRTLADYDRDHQDHPSETRP